MVQVSLCPGSRDDESESVGPKFRTRFVNLASYARRRVGYVTL